MTQKDITQHLQKLGLENPHNGIEQVIEKESMTFENESEAILFAVQTVKNFVNKYRNRLKTTIYILKRDGAIHLCYNDEIGINMLPYTSLDYLQEHVKSRSPEEEYILMVEIKENCFSLVPQM